MNIKMTESRAYQPGMQLETAKLPCLKPLSLIFAIHTGHLLFMQSETSYRGGPHHAITGTTLFFVAGLGWFWCVGGEVSRHHHLKSSMVSMHKYLLCIKMSRALSPIRNTSYEVPGSTPELLLSFARDMPSDFAQGHALT